MAKVRIRFSQSAERVELWTGNSLLATLYEDEFADLMRQISAFVSKNNPEEAKKSETKYQRKARIIKNRETLKSMVSMINPFKSA